MDQLNLFLNSRFALQLVGLPGPKSQFAIPYKTWLYGWKEEGSPFIAVPPAQALSMAIRDLSAEPGEVIVWRIPPHPVTTPDGVQHLRFRCHTLSLRDLIAWAEHTESILKLTNGGPIEEAEAEAGK